ncbi:MAG: NAD(P)H-dependent oxidoreductase [Usitatibacteraceae bacterium]
MSFRPVIVGIGGTTRAGSSTEKALRFALDAAERLGAKTVLLGAADIAVPPYAPERPERTPEAIRLVTEMRRADGIIIASPGYHGGVSGLVKNALDYTEDMRSDDRVYFDGCSVGCIVTAAGWQGTTTTLSALRSIVHALRGWPTPLGVCINSTEPAFASDGTCLSQGIADQLELLASQTVEFARARMVAAIQTP